MAPRSPGVPEGSFGVVLGGPSKNNWGRGRRRAGLLAERGSDRSLGSGGARRGDAAVPSAYGVSRLGCGGGCRQRGSSWDPSGEGWGGAGRARRRQEGGGELGVAGLGLVNVSRNVRWSRPGEIKGPAERRERGVLGGLQGRTPGRLGGAGKVSLGQMQPLHPPPVLCTLMQMHWPEWFISSMWNGIMHPHPISLMKKREPAPGTKLPTLG